MRVRLMTDKRVVLPGLVGNILEWYDFALYGYFASTISSLFFPTDNKTVSFLLTYVVFAMGFIVRPLGAILFGYYGDKFGRKNALSAAILLMAVPTTLIGCLPSYESIGLWAPILMMFFRLLQGLAVGGEFTGSIVYLIEHAPKRRQAIYGSLAMSSAFIGLLIGSVSAYVVYYYYHDVTYAWRIPFLVSLLLGGVGLYLRLGMPESPVFKAFLMSHTPEKMPIAYVLKHYKKRVLLACAVVMLPSCGFYMSFVYLPTALAHHASFTKQVAMFANSISMLFIIGCIPMVGWLAERYSQLLIMRVGAVGFIFLAMPAYYLLHWDNMVCLYAGLFILALLVSVSYALVPVVLVNLFPTKVRLTGMSLPYNLANGIFGGTAPLVGTKLIALTGMLVSLGGYITCLAVITWMMIGMVAKLSPIEME